MKRSYLRGLMALILTAGIVTAGGCVGTVISVTTDAAIELVKVPFKVGGAVIDVVSGDDEEDE